jgi:hypothetical protein
MRQSINCKLTSIVGVHDTSVVEHDIETAPLVDALNKSLDVVLLANIALCGLDFADHIRRDFLCLCKSFLERGFGDIGHDDGSALAQEENGGLETNATGSTGDNGVLAFQAKTGHDQCLLCCKF